MTSDFSPEATQTHRLCNKIFEKIILESIPIRDTKGQKGRTTKNMKFGNDEYVIVLVVVR